MLISIIIMKTIIIMKMKFNTKKWLAISMILFAIGNVSAVFESYVCDDGTSSGNNKCGDGRTPTVMCDTGPTGNCPVICAAECGSATGCITEYCKSCCAAGICKKYPDPSDELNACLSSCVGTCEVNAQFCEIILILQSVAVGMAALMLTINGFKWMTADDASGRTDAKRGVYYVFIGLALVIIAFALVNYLYIGKVTCPF
ncbi:MAG: hypothetical protein DRO62_00390 [Candidatus Altiarchaeales archaeon]|nr:MAG: hypothetical protein DRO62_00390 [Candidatus Altiarchaeales archaeon]